MYCARFADSNIGNEMSNELQTGRIVFWAPQKRFGFFKIDGPEASDCFFHEQEFDGDEPKVDDRVAFLMEPDPRREGRKRAKSVTPISGQS
jgi:cold shock CspA family protein